jgi:hypothetical protein
MNVDATAAQSSTTAAVAAPEGVAGVTRCCSPRESVGCCEPSDKPTCCGPEATSTNGCACR